MISPIGVLPETEAQVIPPISQEGNGVLNDCGPACMLMLLQDCGLAMGETVKHWAAVIDPGSDGTTAANLSNMGKALGGLPELGTAAKYPYIELVQYQLLPFINPNYTGRMFKHWIVRESDTTYFDPLWPQSQAGRKTTTKARLDGAEVAIASRVGLSNQRIPDMTNTTPQGSDARIGYDRVYNLVHPDATLSQYRTVAETAFGLKQTVGSSADDGGIGRGLNSRKVVAWYWPTAGRTGLADFYKQYYPGVVLAFGDAGTGGGGVPLPPPSVIPSFKLGVSVLGAHHLLEPAYQAGVRAFLIMDGIVAAVNFKRAHPDAVVMYRRFLPQGSGIPNPSAFAAEAAMGNGIVFVSPLNECDNWCYGTVAEIEARAKFDTELARMCRDKGTVYAAGGFSMGTPDFTKPEICDAMRRAYAPGYNRGEYAMNWHTYSPNMGWIYGESKRGILQLPNRLETLDTERREDGVYVVKVGRNGHIATYIPGQGKLPAFFTDNGERNSFKRDGRNGDYITFTADPIGQRIWFERRWEFLFDACGFDPNPKLLGIYSDESGVDEGGVGGFPAHGVGGAEILRWGKEFKALSLLPLNGGPSVMRAAVIFQAGDRDKWRGYDVSGNFADIAAANV